MQVETHISFPFFPITNHTSKYIKHLSLFSVWGYMCWTQEVNKYSLLVFEKASEESLCRKLIKKFISREQKNICINVGGHSTLQTLRTILVLHAGAKHIQIEFKPKSVWKRAIYCG